MGDTSISCSDKTWNFALGCTNAGAGCDHCYARTMIARNLWGHGSQFDFRPVPEWLDKPLAWKTPQVVFVNSLSDTFHADMPTSILDRAFESMEAANQHIYLLLTKRPSMMARYVNRRYPNGAPKHIWFGASVEDRKALKRVTLLRRVKSKNRFLSVEPMLEDLGQFDLSGIAWVICGGESGTKARPMEAAWAEELLDHCLAQRVMFHFKQWGGRSPKVAGRLLRGREWNDRPGI